MAHIFEISIVVFATSIPWRDYSLKPDAWIVKFGVYDVVFCLKTFIIETIVGVIGIGHWLESVSTYWRVAITRRNAWILRGLVKGRLKSGQQCSGQRLRLRLLRSVRLNGDSALPKSRGTSACRNVSLVIDVFMTTLLYPIKSWFPCFGRLLFWRILLMDVR